MALLKGYTTPNAVALLLGRSLTADQNRQAEVVIPAAERVIDGYCHRAWLTGAIAQEAHFSPGADLYLRYAPVAAVGTVTGRSGLGATEETLVGDVDYEVRDLATGWLRLACPGRFDRVRVSYTPVATTPDDVELATAMLVAEFLRPTLQPETHGVESFQLPDLSVKFAAWVTRQGMPPAVEALLADHVWPVVG